MIRLFNQHEIRQQKELEGYWQFMPIQSWEIPEVFTEKMYVPGCWESDIAFRKYRGMAAYKKTIVINECGYYKLTFKGISHTAQVYVDGVMVGHHYNAFTAFDKLRVLTNKNNGWGNEYRRQKLKEFVRGWINYFSKADMKGLMGEIDEWIRRRIRAIYWRQWKRVRTKYRMLRALKLPEWRVHEMENCRKGYWRAAKMLNSALTNKIIAKLGYLSMSDYYLKICEN